MQAATFLSVNSILPIARPKVRPNNKRTGTIKQYSGPTLTNSTNKHSNKTQVFDFYLFLTFFN